MKRIILLFSVLTVLLVGCGSKEDDGKLNMPFSSNDLKGANYQEVIATLENAGFTNVQTKAIDDLVFGWLTKDGEIEEVSVDGYTTFSTDSRYAADIEIIVSYHTFPTDEVEESAEASPAVETAPTEQTQPTLETPSSVMEEIITVDNNAEFAAVLNTKDPSDQIIKDFALKYAGQVIEFDGNIAYMSYHGDYTTRYDFLISPWDYNEISVTGPNFKFEDCNIFDLNLIGDNVPDALEMGDNLRFVARIKSYDETSQLFYLDPISSEIR